MKKKILIVTLFLSVFLSGMAVAGSINGVYKGNQVVRLTSDGKELKAADVPAQIVDDRTMVPLYMLRQAGFQVTWEPSTYSVDVKQSHTLTQDQLNTISKSVAKVYVYDANDKPLVQGSGFIIDGGSQGKLLITNYHVGGKGTNLRVEVNGEVIGLRDQMLFGNPQTDIYAAKITTNAPALPYRKDIALEGTLVTAVGYPKAEYKVSQGTITKVNPSSTFTILHFDAAIDSGSSGSALLNDKGEVIGVAYAGENNDNAATPSVYLQQELDKLK